MVPTMPPVPSDSRRLVRPAAPSRLFVSLRAARSSVDPLRRGELRFTKRSMRAEPSKFEHLRYCVLQQSFWASTGWHLELDSSRILRPILTPIWLWA